MKRYLFDDAATLSAVRQTIGDDLEGAGVENSVGFECLVAVTEACTNALLHGRESDGGRPPEVRWSVSGGIVRFHVTDFSSERWGNTSHPSRHVLDDFAEDDGTRIGGVGLDLMKALMDTVDITVTSEGTAVSLTKRVEPVPSRC